MNQPDIGTAVVGTTPLDIVQRAVASNADVDVLGKLLDLQERFLAREARRSFTAALAAFRQNMPTILKSSTVDYTTDKGQTSYKHEDLGDMVEQLSPPLAEHGLSFRWRTDSTVSGSVGVTCILEHADGHAEETTLVGPFDKSGGKNAIQSIGSVTTYLQRYTLKAAVGVAASKDDDGQQGGRDPEPTKEAPTVEARSTAVQFFAWALDVGIVDDRYAATLKQWAEGDQVDQVSIDASIGYWTDRRSIFEDVDALDVRLSEKAESIDLNSDAWKKIATIIRRIKAATPNAKIEDLRKALADVTKSVDANLAFLKDPDDDPDGGGSGALPWPGTEGGPIDWSDGSGNQIGLAYTAAIEADQAGTGSVGVDLVEAIIACAKDAGIGDTILRSKLVAIAGQYRKAPRDPDQVPLFVLPEFVTWAESEAPSETGGDRDLFDGTGTTKPGPPS
jgi:hypothetical protein